MEINTLKFIVIVLMVLLSTDLVYHQVVNGQVSDRPNPIRDMIENGVLLPDGYRAIVPESGISTLMTPMRQIDEINTVLDYCYQHADRPNPVQDLVDKGFLGSEYKNITCKDIKMTYDTIKANITELENKFK